MKHQYSATENPNKKNNDNVKPIKKSDLEPSKENPVNPRQDDADLDPEGKFDRS